MNTAEKTNILLIAAGFDLNQASAFTDALREMGQPVAIVGLTAGPVRSSSGVRLLPDTDLDQPPGGPVGLVLLPGGAKCAEALVRDPRVKRYLQAVVGSGGAIGAAREPRAALPDVEMALMPHE